jgi:hypothetical protein
MRKVDGWQTLATTTIDQPGESGEKLMLQ